MKDGWEGLLDPDEKIQWQGRPDGAFTFNWDHGIPFIFGLFFAGFALFWMIMAAQGSGGFWMFGLLHFLVGLGIALGPVFWPTWQRRHTWYTLTNKRAFIASDLPLKNKRLDSYPITAGTVFSFYDEPLATIHFAETSKRTKKGTHTVKIGFERIPEGRKVLSLMRDIQDKARQKQHDVKREP
ncbi:aspartate carbamoyltransferase catalytic subunit [Shimia sp.]|uniref:aspartate carbamoyltransferase catalytic subunit n=1 Tax=Shimia sp. TaxID=1954381 RepID=UPI0032998035